MVGCRTGDACRKLFFNLQILPLPSQYNVCLLLFMTSNMNQLPVSSAIHHTGTRQRADCHQPSVSLTKHQKGVYCLGVQVFNVLLRCSGVQCAACLHSNSLIIPRYLYSFYRNLHTKIRFNIWRSISNFKKVKFIYL
jgi:hypothetical protein